MMVRWSGEHQVNVKSQLELDIGGRETCKNLPSPRHPPLEVSSSTLMLDLSETEMLDILLQVLNKVKINWLITKYFSLLYPFELLELMLATLLPLE